MEVTWGLTIRFGILPADPDDDPDILDNIELAASSEDPKLCASLVIGEERLELGTVEELIEMVRGQTKT